MPRAGLEPAPLSGQAPKTCVAASYTTSAAQFILQESRTKEAPKGRCLHVRLFLFCSISNSFLLSQFFGARAENL